MRQPAVIGVAAARKIDPRLADLRRQHKIRSIVDEQSETSVLLDQAGQRTGIGPGLGLGVERCRHERSRKSGDTGGIYFHLFHS